MKTLRECPNGCDGDFYAAAHIAQIWRVDRFGNFLEAVEGCSLVTRGPEGDDEWACAACGAVAVTLGCNNCGEPLSLEAIASSRAGTNGRPACCKGVVNCCNQTSRSGRGNEKYSKLRFIDGMKKALFFLHGAINKSMGGGIK